MVSMGTCMGVDILFFFIVFLWSFFVFTDLVLGFGQACRFGMGA